MKETLDLRLGGQTYRLRPFTLRQIRDISITIGRPLPTEPPHEAERGAYERMVGAVAIALGRDYPEMTADRILDTELSLNELQGVYRTVLIHGEFVAADDPAPAASAS